MRSQRFWDVIRVEGYKLLAEHGTSPSDIHEAYQLAQDHNRQSQLKIKIFRKHQPLNFTLTQEDGLGINLKGNVLDTIAIEQIISHQYLVLDYQLFFFDDGTASFVKKVIARPSPTALASLPAIASESKTRGDGASTIFGGFDGDG